VREKPNTPKAKGKIPSANAEGRFFLMVYLLLEVPAAYLTLRMKSGG
jgi:hypothetical protein